MSSKQKKANVAQFTHCSQCKKKLGTSETDYNVCDKCWHSEVQMARLISAQPTSCTHVGNPPVFKINNAGTIYAGGDRDSKYWDLENIDLIISLNGTGKAINPMIIPPEAKAICDKFKVDLSVKPIPCVQMRWSDMGAPPVAPNFFDKILTMASNGANLMIHCTGGHGRTGTALAMLAHRGNLLQPEIDIVDWLRNNYCKKAVESETQLDYLRYQGIETDAECITAQGHITYAVGQKL